MIKSHKLLFLEGWKVILYLLTLHLHSTIMELFIIQTRNHTPESYFVQREVKTNPKLFLNSIKQTH